MTPKYPAVSYQAGRSPATPQDAIRQVRLACRILARFGQEDLTLGHASVRGPDGHTVWIKRKGRALRDVRKKDVIGIALDDEDGHLTPGAHLETIMHLETYRARPDVGAVYPLADAREAFMAKSTEHVPGKVVLTP